MGNLDDSLTTIDWLNSLQVGAGLQDFINGDNNNLSRINNLTKNPTNNNNNNGSSNIANCSQSNKPSMTYCNLIRKAIESTENKCMRLKDIYYWISKEYPYFSVEDKRWKNSIRHNLSINKKLFKKIPRCSNDFEKGCYWTVDKSFYNSSSSTTEYPGNLNRLVVPISEHNMCVPVAMYSTVSNTFPVHHPSTTTSTSSASSTIVKNNLISPNHSNIPFFNITLPVAYISPNVTGPTTAVPLPVPPIHPASSHSFLPLHTAAAGGVYNFQPSTSSSSSSTIPIPTASINDTNTTSNNHHLLLPNSNHVPSSVIDFLPWKFNLSVPSQSAEQINHFSSFAYTNNKQIENKTSETINIPIMSNNPQALLDSNIQSEECSFRPPPPPPATPPPSLTTTTATTTADAADDNDNRCTQQSIVAVHDVHINSADNNNGDEDDNEENDKFIIHNSSDHDSEKEREMLNQNTCLDNSNPPTSLSSYGFCLMDTPRSYRLSDSHDLTLSLTVQSQSSGHSDQLKRFFPSSNNTPYDSLSNLPTSRQSTSAANSQNCPTVFVYHLPVLSSSSTDGSVAMQPNQEERSRVPKIRTLSSSFEMNSNKDNHQHQHHHQHNHPIVPNNAQRGNNNNQGDDEDEDDEIENDFDWDTIT